MMLLQAWSIYRADGWDSSTTEQDSDQVPIICKIDKHKEVAKSQAS